MNKYGKILNTLAFLLILVTASACSKVPAGNVGVKVNLLGSSKGVETEELGVGRYWIGMNEELYIFPTFTQNYVWTKAVNEGSPNDESITFQTAQGLSVSADVGISYSIDPKKVTVIFQKYRKGVEEITDIYLRNMVRDAFVKVVSKKNIESVYGAGKEDILSEVEQMVRSQVGPLGIIVERIYFVGDLRLPPAVVQALNAKIAATQMAQQRENEVASAKAEADKAIATARGTAESKLEIAKVDAEALEMRAKVLRENPQLIDFERITKWNGVLPQVTGGSIPMLNLK